MIKKPIAPTPPMGWNSWDCYGGSVTEEEVRGNALYMAQHLKPFGWEYVVVDIQWYQPTMRSSSYIPYADLCMDGFGRLLPAPNRFPSAADGRGFAPLAAYVHSLGLKFGVHLMRGIPRRAVHDNLPIYGSRQRARDIAHPNLNCGWNTDMYGVDAQASGAYDYYKSVFDLFAQWGVDFVKIDDLCSTPNCFDVYAGAGEIELYAKAAAECGRDMVLSFSPGPAPVEQAEHLKRHGHMWRITNDFWDTWDDMNIAFEACHRWQGVGEEHSWPDADMLPIGHISLRGQERGVGERMTRLTPPEQYSLLSMWCLFRSPLMLGCELRDLDPFTTGLITNREVLQLLQTSRNARQVLRRGMWDRHLVWMAECSNGGWYVALFNRDGQDSHMQVQTSQLGLPANLRLRDLWKREDVGQVQGSITVWVEPHGVKLYHVQEV